MMKILFLLLFAHNKNYEAKSSFHWKQLMQVAEIVIVKLCAQHNAEVIYAYIQLSGKRKHIEAKTKKLLWNLTMKF